MADAAYSLRNKRTENMKEKRRNSLFISLSRSTARLEKLGECVCFPKNHVLMEAGQMPDCCYLLKRGRVLSYEIMMNGEERIYHFYGENSLLLEDDVLFGKTSVINFKTACATELIRIRKETLMAAVAHNPQLALDMMESASVKLQVSMEQNRHARNYSISWKICDVLLSLADYCGVALGNKILIQEKISQQTISNILGVNRITTVRAIKELKNLGLVDQVKGFYRINNIEEFMDYQQSIE